MSKTFTKRDFVNRAHLIHGDTYNYTNTIYVSNAKPVRIDCRVAGHAPFWQTPSNHCKGNGCPACATERRVSGVLSSAARRFVARSQEVHGDLYSYQETVYVNSKSEVTIHCSHHGPFQQTTSLHLRGLGCPACGLERGAAARRDGLDGFIAKATARHGTTYDYTEVVYVNSRTKVKISCPSHGAFFKRPAMHISGEGCPACGMERKRGGPGTLTDGRGEFSA
jgi:Zn finger protein HypA/HybF involved in hydrogenase expression